MGHRLAHVPPGVLLRSPTCACPPRWVRGWIAACASHAAARAPDLTMPLGAALTSRGSGIYSSPGAEEPPPHPVPLQSRHSHRIPPAALPVPWSPWGPPGLSQAWHSLAGSGTGQALRCRLAHGARHPPTRCPLTGRSRFMRGMCPLSDAGRATGGHVPAVGSCPAGPGGTTALAAAAAGARVIPHPLGFAGLAGVSHVPAWPPAFPEQRRGRTLSLSLLQSPSLLELIKG